jgi:hypothetical protein
MKVIVSLTSTPPRFPNLGPILKSLCEQTCHEVWLNVPRKYNRWPDWDGKIPEELYFISPKIRINTDCEDFGPGTKFIGPALKLLPEDLIVYLDDDTCYPAHLLTNLLKWHKTDPRSAWGLSGFTFGYFFQGIPFRQHGQPIDVLEGYGSVIVKAEWIQRVLPEFRELLEVTWHDDMILCNLFEKEGIQRKEVFTPECNVTQVRQYSFGFAEDALHHVAGGSHMENNKNILKNFEDKGKLYYNYKCS